MALKIKRGQKLETRYAYLRQNAKTLTRALELAVAKLSEIAHGGAPNDLRGSMTCSEIRTWTSELGSIAEACGVQERGR